MVNSAVSSFCCARCSCYRMCALRVRTHTNSPTRARLQGFEPNPTAAAPAVHAAHAAACAPTRLRTLPNSHTCLLMLPHVRSPRASNTPQQLLLRTLIMPPHVRTPRASNTPQPPHVTVELLLRRTCAPTSLRTPTNSQTCAYTAHAAARAQHPHAGPPKGSNTHPKN